MSVTVHYDVPLIRSEVPSTYVICLSASAHAMAFYKIGRTKNLTSRLGSLLNNFRDGSPRNLEPFPDHLVGLCAMDGGAFGGCKYGPDCLDHQYDLHVVAHIEGDIEHELHKRFAHLRLDADETYPLTSSCEWFWSVCPDEDEYATSIDAWLADRNGVSA